MTNREIKKILLRMKKVDNLTITDICDKAGIGRSNFTVFLNSQYEKDASGTTMLKLSEAYPEYFKQSIIPRAGQPGDGMSIKDRWETRIIDLEAATNVFQITLIELLAAAGKKSSAVVASELKKAISNEREMLKKFHSQG